MRVLFGGLKSKTLRVDQCKLRGGRGCINDNNDNNDNNFIQKKKHIKIQSIQVMVRFGH